MQVTITGGAGFIGSNLARHFLERDPATRVVVIDDLSTGDKSNLDGVAVDLVVGSILDADLVRSAISGSDSVVHLGAIPSVPRSVADPVASHAANATGTLQVLEAARAEGVSHVVAASSSSVYGANTTLPKRETDWIRPMSPYAVSKAATEGYVSAYAYSYGMKTLPFRFFNVYGPGQAEDHAYAAVVPRFVDAALRGEPVTIHGDGTQTRDFTFVGTVCDVIAQAVEKKVHAPGPVNLAYGSRTSLLSLLDELELVLGRPIGRTFTDPRVGDVKDSQADDSSVRALFPAAKSLTLREGLERTVNWFRTR